MSNKKTRTANRNKGERDRLRKKKEAEQMELEELQDERLEKAEMPMTEVEAEAADEELEKGYLTESELAVYAPQPRPTSFEELDAMRAAEEKAHEVNEVTWDTQDLVRNILNSYDLEATEKADRIMDVADGFAERVNSMMMDADEMQKDLEQLQIEAILGTYQRGLNVLQKAQDWAEDILVKRDLSYKARKRLSEGDFALPGKRKYPIHDKAHVRNALARAAQMIARGGEAAADAKAALPKIRAAAKKFGIEVSKSAIMVEKDGKGDWRWIGKPSNNFMDWQGDIMSKAAHQEYVEFLDKNPDMAPLFMTWHTPGTARENPVDVWMEHEGALIMSGKLTEPEARALLKAQADYDLGMSVFGKGIRNPQDDREIGLYRLVEVSDLPLDMAANPFTSLETMTKEAGMNTDEKVKYLAMYMGSEERAKAFLEKTSQTQKELAQAGLTSKAQEEPQEPPAQPPAEEPKAEPVADTTALTKQIVEAVGKEFDFQGLNAFVARAQENEQKVELLEKMLLDLSKEKDQEMADMLTPPIQKWTWSQDNRPSARQDTILKEDDKEDQELKKAKPGIPEDAWLSQVTNTVPAMDN